MVFLLTASDSFVRDQTPRNQYTATSNQTDFPYDFIIFESEDLTVLETTDPGTASQTTNTLIEGSDYTVQGVGDEDGGKIVLTSGADSGDRYTLTRETTIERLTDFLQSGDFQSDNVNLELDTIITILQEKQLEIDRALTLAKESDLGSVELPGAEADNAIAWNASGDGLINVPLTDKEFSRFLDDENLYFGRDDDYILRFNSSGDWVEIYDNQNDVEVVRFKRNGDFEFPNQAIESKFDHGDVGGLGDDDHTQYLNSTRHDSEDHQSSFDTTFSASSGDIIEFNGTDYVATEWNAANTTYNNADSNLDETDVKNALDELDSEKADSASAASRGYLQPDGLVIKNSSSNPDIQVDVAVGGQVEVVEPGSPSNRDAVVLDGTETFDISTSGAGGLINSSSRTDNTWYEPGVIYDSTNGTVSVAGWTDANRPTTVSDLPGDYDYFRAMGSPGKTWWIQTDGSSNIRSFDHNNDGDILWSESTLANFSDLLNTTSVNNNSNNTIDVSSQLPPTKSKLKIGNVKAVEGAGSAGSLAVSRESLSNSRNGEEVIMVEPNGLSGDEITLSNISNQQLNWRSDGITEIVIKFITKFKAVN